jgi:FlaA1/EpsC-like NDP-sugar epimerase
MSTPVYSIIYIWVRKHLIGTIASKQNIYYLNILKNSFAWIVSGYITILLRYEFSVPDSIISKTFIATLILILIYYFVTFMDKAIFGTTSSLTFEEFIAIVRRFLITGLIFFLGQVVYQDFILPRSFPLLTSVLALGLVLSFEKILKFYIVKNKLRLNTVPVAIYGGGEQGQLLIHKIFNDENSDWRPVVIIDDFLSGSINKINGIKLVKGEDIDVVYKEFKFKIIIITFSQISANKLQKVQDTCNRLNLELLIIPPIKAITGQEFSMKDLRRPSQEELIGKSSIKISTIGVQKFLEAKVILVTGAGGSIGSELCRQISNYSPHKLYLLDRDESNLLDVNLTLNIFGSINQDDLILADIRDDVRIKEIIARVKPNIVFHAAALKHLSILENNPDEAVKTNISGTNLLLQESLNNLVDVFINVSTDKAADPISILGKSKLCAERLTKAASTKSNGSRYLSVRFGNVFGSRGSVLHTFNKQIENGGPITITSPGVTRYFMTVEEAVHLLLQAAADGENGETLILDMGEPIQIEAIAKKLIAASSKSIEIQFTGLRKGEKLHESLIGEKELILNPINKNIVRVSVEPLTLPLGLNSWKEISDIVKI